MRRLVTAFAVFVVILGFQGCSDDDILTDQEQLELDIRFIDNYLQENGIDAIEDPSGVRYVIHTAGTGPKPSLASTVRVNYTGRFFNGTIFETNSDVQFPLGGVILGWQIALTKVNEGSEVTVYIPSGLAYGPSSTGNIPPNSNLIFDIDLLEVF